MGSRVPSTIKENTQQNTEKKIKSTFGHSVDRNTEQRRPSIFPIGSTSRLQAPPVILCSLETAAVRGNTGDRAGRAEIKMLTFSMGVDRMDRIRSENIRVTAC